MLRLLFSLAILPLALSAAETPPPPELAHPPEVVTPARLAALPPHPRLLATAADFERLRGQLRSDPATAELHALLAIRAERLRAAPPVDFAIDSHTLLPSIREAQRRLLTFALLHQLERDPVHLEAARPVIASLLARAWDGRHFLENAEAAFALAVAYDWLHDALRPAELDAIADKLHREALLRSVTDEERNGWLWAAHNWNQVCHGGLVTAAIALAERHPELSHRIINRAVAMLPRAAAAYAPDGAYPEGPTYWAYGTTFQLIQLEAYRAALGDSLGLERFPGFLRSGEAIDLFTGPTGAFYNHSDNFATRYFKAASLWFARENRNPALALAELERQRRQGADFASDDYRDLPLALLWWRPLADYPRAAGPAARPPLAWTTGGVQPVAVLRSAWDAPDATWLALKGGTAGHSHAHMDAGSFVLEALGVRWALDLERESYTRLRAAGYAHSEIFSFAQDSRRWSVFRFGPEGHNILRFDAAPQLVSGHAAIAPLLTDASGSTVEIDLSSTYAGQVAHARRRATLHPDATITLADTWTTLDAPTRASWQWLTRAEITRTEDGLLLAQDGRQLRLHIHNLDTARVEIQPVDTLLTPGLDTAAPELRRIVLSRHSPARTADGFTIRLFPGAGVPPRP
jgi:hypothetical protein